MKVIIAGSRGIEDYPFVEKAIKDSGFEITEVVSGGARGVDRLGERWAREHGIAIRQFLPDWNTHGKSAGFIRNDLMVKYADALICIWDGTSRGTKHTLDQAKRKGLKVYLKRTDKIDLSTISPYKDVTPNELLHCGYCGELLSDEKHDQKACEKEADEFIRDNFGEYQTPKDL
jgi:hypothetical protein